MVVDIKTILFGLHRTWLRARLDACARSLQSIEAQRANDFHAERVLHRKMSEMRSKLRAL